ncbi:MAG TPA: Asd/ArgC dimerization domain-containing protein [Candidatus Acidoferrum sp.]|nr:Asd/ArgC dimerization domain-containing protein [Candidatus Acidoferrum sp.]
MASTRIVIAGASSLLGAELKSLLEESRFAASEFRLVDEDLSVGTLTEAAGEAAIIQPVEEDSFNRATIIFFTGSAQFTRTNLGLARRSGAILVDLSGELISQSSAAIWFSNLDSFHSKSAPSQQTSFAIPSAPAIAAASLSLALSKFVPERLTLVALQSASESGRKGIEELEHQSSKLLSFQPVGSPVFDTQVAFNLLDRFGPQSKESLSSARDRLRRELAAILVAPAKIPAVQLIQAPVFYGTAFTLAAKLAAPADSAGLTAAAKSAGLLFNAEPGPSNLSVAGESFIHLAAPAPDPSDENVWWFFGAADNIRLPAHNAVKLAEKLLP